MRGYSKVLGLDIDFTFEFTFYRLAVILPPKIISKCKLYLLTVGVKGLDFQSFSFVTPLYFGMFTVKVKIDQICKSSC